MDERTYDIQLRQAETGRHASIHVVQQPADDPGLTVVRVMPEKGKPIYVYGLRPGETVDWGDGTVETYEEIKLPNYGVTHTYREVPWEGYILKTDSNLVGSGDRRGNLTAGALSAASVAEAIHVKKGMPELQWLFWQCHGLKAIRESFFNDNPEATNYMGCFTDCPALQEIPAGLFAKHVPAAGDSMFNFNYMFSGCKAATGKTPRMPNAEGAMVRLWELTGAMGDGAFSGCRHLDDYGEIPGGWR